MKKLIGLLDKASGSKLNLWLLNTILYRVIPFNKPHRIHIKTINKHEITTSLPYRRKNLNHIKGMHACAMATLGEFTSGLMLLYRLDPTAYRIILKEIKCEYYYQCKSNATGKFQVTDEWVTNQLIEPLKKEEKILTTCITQVYDQSGNHVADIHTTWQLKEWSKVKTNT